MKKISREKTWIATDGWRGYERPVNAVCATNDTGMWDDSPCPSNVAGKELNAAKGILKRNSISYVRMTCQTSNGFCVHHYLVTAEEDMARARELITPLVNKSRLLYVV